MSALDMINTTADIVFVFCEVAAISDKSKFELVLIYLVITAFCYEEKPAAL